jgi:hypothetical protein
MTPNTNREEQQQRVAEAVKKVSTEEGIAEWLRMRKIANIGRLSFRNQILVMTQAPHATMILTERAWEREGRKLLYGAWNKPIWILKPIIVTDQKPILDEDGEPTGKTTPVQHLVGWSDLKEYDLAQTDGKPVKQPTLRRLQGDSLATQWDSLVEWAKGRGWTVKVETLQPENLGGYCDTEAKCLVISDNKRDVNERVRVLIHELAHSHGIDYKKYARDDAEVIVEIAAALVLSDMGESIDGSAIYIAVWADGDLKMVQQRLQLADDIAKSIEKGINWTEDEEVQAAA